MAAPCFFACSRCKDKGWEVGFALRFEGSFQSCGWEVRDWAVGEVVISQKINSEVKKEFYELSQLPIAAADLTQKIWVSELFEVTLCYNNKGKRAGKEIDNTTSKQIGKLFKFF